MDAIPGQTPDEVERLARLIYGAAADYCHRLGYRHRCWARQDAVMRGAYRAAARAVIADRPVTELQPDGEVSR